MSTLTSQQEQDSRVRHVVTCAAISRLEDDAVTARDGGFMWLFSPFYERAVFYQSHRTAVAFARPLYRMSLQQQALLGPALRAAKLFKLLIDTRQKYCRQASVLA